MKREKTKYVGVYSRVAQDRTSPNGKSDIAFDITYKQDGRKVWEKVGFKSEGYDPKLADQVRAERIRAMRHGQELPSKQKAPLFSEVAKKYMTWAEGNKCRQGYDDKNLYKNHLATRFDNKRMTEITSFALEKMKQDLKAQGLSPATIGHCLKLLRQIFNKARIWGLYKADNPVKDVKMPKLQNDRQRFLSQDEAEGLLASVRVLSDQLADMALLSLHTGMRAGEIFNIKMHDIDFDNDLITISDTKNAESRKAYMTSAVKDMLKKYKKKKVKKTHKKEEQKFEERKPDDYVFADKSDKKIMSISKTFGEIIATTEINKGYADKRQHISFHSLRHTFASWLAIQGESILTIGALLGHKSVSMTKRYAHLSPDHKRRAVELFEKNIIQKQDRAEQAQA